jgi:hypothetical protein
MILIITFIIQKMIHLFLSYLDEHFDSINQCFGLIFMLLNFISSFIAFSIDDTFINVIDQLLKINGTMFCMYIVYFIIQKQMNDSSLRRDVGSIQTSIMEQGFANMERRFANFS